MAGPKKGRGALRRLLGELRVRPGGELLRDTRTFRAWLGIGQVRDQRPADAIAL